MRLHEAINASAFESFEWQRNWWRHFGGAGRGCDSLDVGTVGGLLSLLVELPDDARDILSGLGSFALTVPTEPNQLEFRAVLTVDEP